MKRYLLFGYWRYYPDGGKSDAIGSFNTVDDAKKYIVDQDLSMDYYEILDMQDRIWVDFTEFNTDVYK